MPGIERDFPRIPYNHVMIDFSAVLAVALVCAVAILSPGPNFVAVTHRAVTASRTEALALALGIALVSALWAAAALFGLGLLFALLPWLFGIVKLLGAGYLLWIGLRLLRGTGTPLPERPAVPVRGSLRRAFGSGMITNLSNPKAMVFYGSVFSAFVPAGTSSATQAAMVVAVGLIATLWYGGVAWFLAAEPAARLYRRFRPVIEATCGLLLIAFGIRQALAPA
jgi:threonine/homoserine/homoserine lactone efflux protein